MDIQGLKPEVIEIIAALKLMFADHHRMTIKAAIEQGLLFGVLDTYEATLIASCVDSMEGNLGSLRLQLMASSQANNIKTGTSAMGGSDYITGMARSITFLEENLRLLRRHLYSPTKGHVAWR